MNNQYSDLLKMHDQTIDELRVSSNPEYRKQKHCPHLFNMYKFKLFSIKNKTYFLKIINQQNSVPPYVFKKVPLTEKHNALTNPLARITAIFSIL